LEDVSVADIILAVDEPIDATQCGGKENCKDQQKCLTHDLWTNLNNRIFDYLESVTLRNLVDDQKTRNAGVRQVQDMRDSGSRVSGATASL
jgi:Rrf2 family iron-sulfur cluster assembly transcriptional regulator